MDKSLLKKAYYPYISGLIGLKNMKLLAIHANKLFFQPHSPKVYSFFSEKRGKKEAFDSLDNMYETKKVTGPLLLSDVCNITMKGITKEQYVTYCEEYWNQYKSNNIEKELKKLKQEFDLIYIFTSYPAMIYAELIKEELVDNVFGVHFQEKDGIIGGLKNITLKNEDKIKEELKKISLSDKFTVEPNRYGLLEILIEEMITNNIKKEDVVVIGKGVTALPMHNVSSKQYENFFGI
ncbi:MAG: hypothetical protein HN726_00395 [Candidatus Magasanikbacteria bacterium]|jgi:hypothetical protein|nr:hypothetical protein [Candidatus Magasanikbacteria bacterium]MBT7754642.1 hypothetical protein [Candidatus Magasanikbacteria bacterium]